MLEREVASLPADLGELLPCATSRIASVLTTTGTEFTKVYLVGSGDSYCVAAATAMSFRTLASIDVEAVSAQRHADYDADWARPKSLVVVISASGDSPPAMSALERARARGMTSIAISTNPKGQLSLSNEHAVVLPLREPRRCPGVRTYQAGLVGALLLAIALGEARRTLSATAAAQLRSEILAMATAIRTTAEGLSSKCEQLARTMLPDAPVHVLGSGPSYGTACYAAAKLVEIAGVTAVGRELDEWWHVERFMHPPEATVVFVAPEGRSMRRAAQLALAARELGRRVVAVVPTGTSGRLAAEVVLGVDGLPREELSPLAYHLFATRLAVPLGERLGRPMFQSHRHATVDTALPSGAPSTDVDDDGG